MKRGIAVLLAASLMLGTVACSKKKADDTNVSQSFYEMKSFSSHIGSEVNGWAGNQEAVYVDDECIVVVENCIVGEMDDATGFGTPKEDDDIFRACKYSIKEDDFGTLISSYDLSQLAEYDANGVELAGVGNIAFTEDGYLKVTVEVIDYSSSNRKVKLVTIDMDNGEIISSTDTIKVDIPGGSNYAIGPIKYCEGNYYIVSTSWSAVEAKINKYDEELNLIETIDVENFDDSLCDIYMSDIVDSEKFVFMGSDMDGLDKCCVYDVTTNAVTVAAVHADYTSSLIDGALYTTNAYDLSKYDLFTGEGTVLIDYNTSLVNRNAVQNLSILTVKGDKIICSEMSRDDGYNYVVFSKSDVDPYEGRKAITVANLSIYDTYGAINDAMYEFNCTNSEYYICLDTKYLLKNYADVDFNNSYTSYIESSEYKEGMRAAEAELVSQLSVDIMAGEGPDIILDGYDYSQFNSKNIMVDLNSYIDRDSEFNKDDFWSAIFYTNTDGLYQLPYEVTSYLITANSDALDYCEDNGGITLENYARFVDEQCNGLDPLRSTNLSKAEYFVFLFNASRNMFIDNGNINLDNDALREIAEYCYALPDVKLNYDEYSIQFWEQGITAYFDSWGGGDFYYGRVSIALPSPDASAPQLLCKKSIGITTSCSNPDVAWEFVKGLYVDNDSVNKAGFLTSTQSYIDEVNANKDYVDPWDPEYQAPYYEDDALDVMYAVMDNATITFTRDSDIDMILYEEIQAYLAGDKTLDEIIPIMQDRCNTVIKERG